jgi:serine/threonine-protein kinase
MDDSLLCAGTVLGGAYRIVRLLGRGGMGVVYEAVQEGLGRRVAVKVLSAAHDPELLERFRREAIAAASLGHPSIVGVTDFRVSPGEPPFLVMDLLEGESLGRRVERTGPLAPSAVVAIASQVLAALDAAHARRIVHRDVKPDNVFLTSTPTAKDVVKLLDFGIAKLAPEEAAPLTRAGEVIGTPAFMAPEQADGAQVDARTDLFAVGATMYFALTGRPPGEPLARVRPRLARGLVAVVERALSPEPASRFATAEEMRLTLAALPVEADAPEESTPTVAEGARATVIVARGRRTENERRLAPAAALVALLGIASVVAMVFWARRPRSDTFAPVAPAGPSASAPPSAVPIVTGSESVVESPVASSPAVPRAPASPVVRAPPKVAASDGEDAAVTPIDTLPSTRGQVVTSVIFTFGDDIDTERALGVYAPAELQHALFYVRSHITRCMSMHGTGSSQPLVLTVDRTGRGVLRAGAGAPHPFSICVSANDDTVSLRPSGEDEPVRIRIQVAPLLR